MKRNFLTLATAGVIALGGFAVVQAQTGHGRGAQGHGHGFGLERLTEGLDLTPDQQAKPEQQKKFDDMQKALHTRRDDRD